MGYKKVIPNRDIRLKLLGLLDFIPDRLMIKLQYWIKTGRRVNLASPKRFTEKLQWYKLYYRDPLMTQCADKYRVREYIASKGFEDILIPLCGVYESVEMINFDVLPDKFVFKTNNGSQTNIICQDKSNLDKDKTTKTLHTWLIERTAKAGREWPYYNIKPNIICEQFLEDRNNHLIDYKFICFDGKVACVFVSAERDANDGMKFGIYNDKFEKLPYRRAGLRDMDSSFLKPSNYEQMVRIAEKLSEDFPHVRVDLYNVDGKIYFGEMTFFHGSGYIDFVPDVFDYELGNLFKLEKMMF